MGFGWGIGCCGETVIVLNDVPEVKGADGAVIPWLTMKDVPALIAESVVAGGMLPKLEACSNALRRGVGRVRILPAAQAEVLPQFYFQKLEYGTEVIGA